VPTDVLRTGSPTEDEDKVSQKWSRLGLRLRAARTRRAYPVLPIGRIANIPTDVGTVPTYAVQTGLWLSGATAESSAGMLTKGKVVMETSRDELIQLQRLYSSMGSHYRAVKDVSITGHTSSH